MDDNKRKEMVKNTFNTVAEGYDHPNLAFFPSSAQCFSQLLDIDEGNKILDIGTGTGYLSLKLAESHPECQVTGIDLSNNMIERAKNKAKNANLANVDFKVMDMENLDFPDESFDYITSSFSLFFVNDMENLLAKLKKKLKKGGKIAACSFSENSFDPLSTIFYKDIESYGVEIPSLSWKRISTVEKKKGLFNSVGFDNLDFHHSDLSYSLENKEAWWDIIWNAGFRGLVEQIEEHRREEFKEKHLNEIHSLNENGKIHLNVNGLYTIATK